MGSDQRRDASSLLRWLSPEDREIEDYDQELKSAQELRYNGTCQWIRDSPEYKNWLTAVSRSQEALLWILGPPGAGKTILSSFIVEDLFSMRDTAFSAVLFFMFKYANCNRRTQLAAACSIVYQLLKSMPSGNGKLHEELVKHKDGSGQEKAKNFDALWRIFCKHANMMNLKIALVVDALDECVEAEAFLRSLKDICLNGKVQVVILSRPEKELTRNVATSRHIRFGARENSCDIATFVERSIAASRTLSSRELVDELMHKFQTTLSQVLLTRSEGSFQWAKTVLQELETKHTASEIVETIEQTPSGISDLYASILRSYVERYDASMLKVCRDTLQWLACAFRPLSVNETWEILKLQRTGSASNTSKHDTFLLHKQDLVRSCGSLVIEKDQTLQLTHLSLSQFLCSPRLESEQNRIFQSFFINLPDHNMTLTMRCIEYMKSCFDILSIPTQDMRRQLDMPELYARHHFLDYAVCHWHVHLADAQLLVEGPVPTLLVNLCLGIDLLYWLEAWFSRKKQTSWSLLRQIRRIEKNASLRVHDCAQAKQSSCASFVLQWSRAMLQLLERHGRLCEDEPSYIHFVDPASFEEQQMGGGFFSDFRPHQPPIFKPHLRINTQSHQHAQCSAAKSKKPNHYRLNGELLGLFHVDTNRGIVLSAEYSCTTPKLYCQKLLDGQSLEPMVYDHEGWRYFRCEGYTTRKDGRYVAIYYRSTPHISWDDIRDQKHHLTVYEILDGLDLENNHEVSWCKSMGSIYWESQYLSHCPQPLAFDTDRTILCPYGRMRLLDESFGPITGQRALDSVQSLKNAGSFGGIAFVADDQSQVLLDRESRTLTRLRTSNGEQCTADSSLWPEVIMVCVSPRGRFAVLQEPKGHALCLLHDFSTNTTRLLENSDDIGAPFNAHLSFTNDEQCLVAIITPDSNDATSYIARWAYPSEDIRYRRSSSFERITGMDLRSVTEHAYLATVESWFQIDLDRLSKVSSYNSTPSFICKQQVSVQGDRLAVIMHALRDPKNRM